MNRNKLLHPRKRLILPIEIKGREFHGRLLLAAVAAERGWGVILGSKYKLGPIMAAQAPGALVIEHNVTRNYGKTLFAHMAAGRRVCAWCEEGLVYLGRADYQARRIDAEVLRKIERFFLWGHEQEDDTLDAVPDVAPRLAITGNPRFDLLRPELRGFYRADVKRLRKSYGRFILINTNFGRANHYNGRDWVLPDLKAKGMMDTPEAEDMQVTWMAHQVRLYDDFVTMTRAVSAAFPGHTIVLRPHPSESRDTWRALLEGCPNARVVHEGDVTPWLLAADVIIHNSCTTGVQAYLLGKPVLAYLPIQSERFDSYLPNALSDNVTTLPELISALARSIANPMPVADVCAVERRRIADRYITGIAGPLASDRIMDELDRLDIEPKELVTGLATMTPVSVGKMAHLLRRLLLPLPSASIARSRMAVKAGNADYVAHKFPGLNSEELQRCLKTLRVATGRFGNVRALALGTDTFHLLSAEF